MNEGENGIPNVALTLYDTNGTPADTTDDIPVAQTTTDDAGLYLFDWLPVGEYYVVVAQTNFEPTGLLRGCSSSNELIDEDNPNLDQDNVVLMLLDGNKEPVMDYNNRPMTTTTDSAGYYLFTDLLPGNYVVQVLPSNFEVAGVLAGYRSSTTTEEDPNQDGDTNDNGIDESTPLLIGVCSNVVTLAHTSEPGQEPDPGELLDRALDANSNLTVDFGFYAQPPTAIAEEAKPTVGERLFLPFITRNE